MNSKQRVYAALRGEKPDKIPMGEFSIDFDVAEKILGRKTYYRAKARTQQMLWEGRRDELVDSLKEDIVELYKKLGCLDIVNLSCYAGGILPPRDYEPDPPKKIAEGVWEDKKGRIYKYSEQTADIVLIQDDRCWEEDFSPESFRDKKLTLPDESEFEVVDYVIERLGAERFIISPSGADIGLLLLGGFERGLTEYITNEEGVRAAYEYYLKQENLNDSVRIRKGSDAVLFQNDYSYNDGCFIAPELFRRLGVPPMIERVKNAKKYVPFVLKHSCGNNQKLLDDFRTIGIDCYQGIQPTAGMDIFQVHREYAKYFACWGGIPVETYVSGTVEEIENIARELFQKMKEETRFIAGSSHSIVVGTKYENFMRYLEIAEKLR